MNIAELLEDRSSGSSVNKGSLTDALKSGWTLINYTKKNGKFRVLQSTQNPDLYSYNFKGKKKLYPHLIIVWEKDRGWRALVRSRIMGWAKV
jgi:hypothetical protein